MVCNMSVLNKEKIDGIMILFISDEGFCLTCVLH